MKRTMQLMFYPALISLTMSAGMVAAQPPGAMTQQQSIEGQQFQNLGEEDQLRHRVKENEPEQAKKVRAMKQEQSGKKSQHQYRYEEKSPGQHMQRSGSGMGGGGGGGRR